MLVSGLPNRSLTFLLHQLRGIEGASICSAIGMSSRPLQRQKSSTKPLSADKGSRLWKLAEVLAAARQVFGGLAAAEEWMKTPALALNGNRPIDLMSTSAGAEAVSDLLGRLEYGVYS